MTEIIRETIFAQSTAKGKAGISIIRISGSNSLSIIQKLTNKQEFESHKLYLCDLQYNNNIIDRAMVVYFKAPNSFTGEDVVELHLHGSIAIMRLVTEVLLEENIRIAEAGEFTKRAFLNDKMDLTSVEGLADLIEAETIAQHRHAMRHMSGEFEKICNKWREQLLHILALLEVYIDFPDENIPEEVIDNALSIINDLKQSLDYRLKDNRKGERLRSGISMAVLGEPNVGKSSMLNYLAKRDIAIISDIAGTTRDIIETHIDIGGYPIILSDTAGVRDTSDIIEKEGVKRAIKLAQNADIKLIMLDVRNMIIPDSILDIIDDNSIIIANKIDLQDCSVAEIAGKKILFISLRTGDGLNLLFDAIISRAENLAGIGNDVVITRERHRSQIFKAKEALERCNLHGDLVLSTEDIRIATRHLSMLTGRIETEEILGEIFKNFCIGK